MSIKLTAQDLINLRNRVIVFQHELDHWRRCEDADAETDRDKRDALRRAVITDAILWRTGKASPKEVDLLFQAVKEAARVALAAATADFRRDFSIELSCGETKEEGV